LFLDLSQKGGEEMKRGGRHFSVSILLLTILMGAIGCSSTSAKYKVILEDSETPKYSIQQRRTTKLAALLRKGRKECLH
jgi:hypothetical protein